MPGFLRRPEECVRAQPEGGAGPAGRESPGSHERAWLNWLQQAPSLIYFLAGAFLVGLYWKRLHQRSVLLCGVLFLLYSVYRFFLVRRSLRRTHR